MTAGYCDGTHFIGFEATFTVYKIASCSSDTAATITPAFGLYGSTYGETANISGSQYSVAPSATSSCNSSASYCFGSSGDRSLTRTIAGDTAWLYAQTHNPTYLAWADEWTSATLGGPTAGLNTAVNVGAATLPCSGPACDGFVNDMIYSAPSCFTSAPPCAYGVTGVYSNLGKNFAEAWGAPGIDNELAYRLAFAGSAKPAKGFTCGKCVALYAAPPEPHVVQKIHRFLSFVKNVFYKGYRTTVLAASVGSVTRAHAANP
jgi:hypothetical protein